MRLVPANAATPAFLAFVGDDELHARGFADDAAQRRNASLHDLGDQSAIKIEVAHLVAGDKVNVSVKVTTDADGLAAVFPLAWLILRRGFGAAAPVG